MNITKEQFEAYVESFGLIPQETTSNMIGWYCHIKTGVPLTALDKFTRIWPEESRLGRMLHLSNEDALKFAPEFFLTKKAVRADKIIYKYQLDLKPRNSITMPVGAKILTVQLQKGLICIWGYSYARHNGRACLSSGKYW